MAQNLNFSVKKAQFWLVPILVLAGLFSWANVQGSGKSQAQPVQTELIVSASKSKAAKRLWYAITKRFVPTATTPTEEYTGRAIEVRLDTQEAIYGRIRTKLSFAKCFWIPQSLTSAILC